MLNRKNRLLLIVVFLLGVMALLFTTNKPLKPKLDVRDFHGTLLDTPREISPFALTGVDGMPFNNACLKNQWTFIFFGFTRCGSMCPTTMAELAKMQRMIQAQGINPIPHVVMISLDPTRDTQDKLKQYVTAFHPQFFGARGDESAIRSMTKELGIAYMTVTRRTSSQSTYEDIEHTGAIMLFNPQGQLVAFFTTPHQASSLAHDYGLLLASS